jgi:hypothetical protein
MSDANRVNSQLITQLEARLWSRKVEAISRKREVESIS